MTRKKPTPRWDFDPVQPLKIGKCAGGQEETEETAIGCLSEEQFEAILAHLNLVRSDKTARLKHQLEHLCASAARTMVQEEEGPTRGQRMAAMHQFSSKVDQFKALLAELQKFEPNNLDAHLDAIIVTKWKSPGAAFELNKNLTTVLKHLSRSSSRLAQGILSNTLNEKLTCLSPLKLGHYVATQKGACDGKETVF